MSLRNHAIQTTSQETICKQTLADIKLLPLNFRRIIHLIVDNAIF